MNEDRTLRRSEDWLAAYMRRFEKVKAEDHTALPLADLESDSRNGSEAAHAREKVNSRVRIRLHSKRRRLCDSDGLYAKAAIDGIVRGGILVDDNPTFVEAVTFSQEKISEDEETIIEIWEIE